MEPLQSPWEGAARAGGKLQGAKKKIEEEKMMTDGSGAIISEKTKDIKALGKMAWVTLRTSRDREAGLVWLPEGGCGADPACTSTRMMQGFR